MNSAFVKSEHVNYNVDDQVMWNFVSDTIMD